MFYPCTIKDKDNKVIKHYSSKELSERHWKQFHWSLRLNPRKNTILPMSLVDYSSDIDMNFYLP